MNNSIWRRLIIAGLAACTVAALAAPASGQTLHRDGSKAVPFVANVSKQADASSGGLVLRRDGSKAVPVVLPDTAATAPDGFNWGDAAIGAAAAVGLMLLAATSWLAARRRRRPGVLRGSSA
jgi:hypothetical protein